MEKKLGKLFSSAGKNAKDILEKSKSMAVQMADQNDDGKFDLEDVSVIASSLEDAVKKRAQSLKETADEKARQMELKILQPIVLEDLNGLSMPRFIRIGSRNHEPSDQDSLIGRTLKSKYYPERT